MQSCQRGRFEQTDSRCRSPPETDRKSAQQPEAGLPPGLKAARPQASQRRARRTSRGSARMIPGMGGPRPQGTRVSAPTGALERELERWGCMAHPR